MLCIEEFRIVSSPATQFLFCFRLPSGPAFASPVGTARSAFSEAACYPNHGSGFRGHGAFPKASWCWDFPGAPPCAPAQQLCSPSKLLPSLCWNCCSHFKGIFLLSCFSLRSKPRWAVLLGVSHHNSITCFLSSVCPVPSSLSAHNLLREKAPTLHLLRYSLTCPPGRAAAHKHSVPRRGSFRG